MLSYASIKPNIRICILDPSNRTYYSGGELLDKMYSSCSDEFVNITSDIYAIAYHHWPGLGKPTTLKHVNDFIKKVNPPNLHVPTLHPAEDLPSAEVVVDYIKSQYHALVVGGSDDSANDESPYVKLFIRVLERLIKDDFPIMGYCFGAQAIARAAYGSNNVMRLEKRTGKSGGEFGFISYKMTDFARSCPLFRGVSDNLISAALHNECFVVNENELLFSSLNCPHSAFKLNGKRCFGFQFHLDFTKEEGEKFFELQLAACKDTQIIRDHHTPDLDSSRVIIRNFIHNYVLQSNCM
jgi:GMP synthase-like glutamine amidotransferase